MISPQYCIAAKRLVRDAQTNTVSAFDILEEVPAQAFPRLIQKLDAVAVFERSANDPLDPPGSVTVKLDDDVLYTGSLNVRFETALRTRSFVSFTGLSLPRPGKLRIIFSIDGDEKGSVSLPVQLVGSPSVTVKQEPSITPTSTA